jgi:hypothetical protein
LVSARPIAAWVSGGRRGSVHGRFEIIAVRRLVVIGVEGLGLGLQLDSHAATITMRPSWRLCRRLTVDPPAG